MAHALIDIYEIVEGEEASTRKTADFTDIVGHPMELDIQKAYALGLLNGRSDTIFAPDDFVTRQEAAKLLTSLLVELESVRISDEVPSLDYYLDAQNIADWAATFVDFAYENGIMQGSDDYFLPANNLTREQCLIILARMVEEYDWAK